MVIELIQAHPRVSIIVISFLVSLFISTINFFVLDKKKLRESRARQKELNAKMKENKNDPAKLMELQKEMMEHSLQQMKHSLKPMIITIIPVLLVFHWVRGIFSETTIAGSWLWWYIIAALIFSLIFRKIFKLP